MLLIFTCNLLVINRSLIGLHLLIYLVSSLNSTASINRLKTTLDIVILRNVPKHYRCPVRKGRKLPLLLFIPAGVR